jgi:hypothetical protein
VGGRAGSAATRKEARKRGCLWDQAGSSSQHDRVSCLRPPATFKRRFAATLQHASCCSLSIVQAVMRHRLGGGRMMGAPAETVGTAATGYDRSGAVKATGTVSAARAAAATCTASATRAAAAETGGSGAVTSVHTRVHHVRQNFKWDCGIACILMLMRTRGDQGMRTREDLIALVGTNSVWTVDLAYIMHKCGLSCVFHTVMEGVREEYAAETFYKDELDEDRARVEKLFRGARTAGVAVKTEAVTIAQIAAAVLQGRLAIVLTDRRILRPKSDEKEAAGLRTRSERVSYKTRATSSKSRAGTTGSEAASAAKAYDKAWVSSERDATIVSAELSGSFTGHYVVRISICCMLASSRLLTTAASPLLWLCRFYVVMTRPQGSSISATRLATARATR